MYLIPVRKEGQLPQHPTEVVCTDDCQDSKDEGFLYLTFPYEYDFDKYTEHISLITNKEVVSNKRIHSAISRSEEIASVESALPSEQEDNIAARERMTYEDNIAALQRQRLTRESVFLHSLIGGFSNFRNDADTFLTNFFAPFREEEKASFINNTDNNKNTALHVLCKRNFKLILSSGFIRVLIENNVDVNMTDDEGNTALHIAALLANKAIFQAIIECGRADLTIVNGEGMTILEFAMLSMMHCHPPRPESRHTTISFGPTYYEDNREAIVNMLIEHPSLSTFVNAGRHWQYNPLEILCTHRTFRDQTKSIGYLEKIVQAGFPLKRICFPGRSSFFGALECSRLHLAEKMLLLEEHVDDAPADRFIMQINPKGETAFHVLSLIHKFKNGEYMCGSGNLFQEMHDIFSQIQKLLNRAGPVREILNAKSTGGVTALTLACQHVLIQPRGHAHEEKVVNNSRFSHYHLALVITFLENGIFDRDIKDDAGKTAFDYLIPGVTNKQILEMPDDEIAHLQTPLELLGFHLRADNHREYLQANESTWLSTVLPSEVDEARGGNWSSVKIIFEQIRFSIDRMQLQALKPAFK